MKASSFEKPLVVRIKEPMEFLRNTDVKIESRKNHYITLINIYKGNVPITNSFVPSHDAITPHEAA